MKLYDSQTYTKDLEEIYQTIDFSQFKNKKILITGANGLICSYLIDLLIYINLSHNYNIDIYALSRNDTKLKERFGKYYDKSFFHPVIQDVCMPINIDGLNYIIHGASNAAPRLYVEDPVNTMNSNYLGMLNVLQNAQNNKSKVIYISSSEIYGIQEKNIEYSSENDYGYIDILNVRSSYSESKRASETLCIAYYNQYGVDVSIVRPAHIYGPTYTKTDTRAVSDFIRNAIEGKDIYMKSDGSSIRSYCYVGDAVTGIFTVILKGKSGESYNISNNENIISIKDLATKIAKLNNQKLVIKIPDDLIEKKVDSNVKLIKISNQKLQKLGWKCKTNVDNGLQKTVQIIKEKNDAFGKKEI